MRVKKEDLHPRYFCEHLVQKEVDRLGGVHRGSISLELLAVSLGSV